MDLAAITPTGFYGINYGDGTTVELIWSIADIYSVHHYTLERFDTYSKRWLPYDGFHGTLTKKDGNGQVPPQRVIATVDESGTHTFRINASDGKNETDWITTTVDVIFDNEQRSPSHLYFVQNGLEVTNTSDRTFGIVLVSHLLVELGCSNTAHIHYIRQR